MADIVIRVGAARDASLSTVFAPLEAASRRARTRVAKDSDDTGAAVGRGARKGTDAAERAFAELARESARWEKQMARDATNAEREKARAAQQTAKERARLLAQETREAERAGNAQARATEKAEKASLRAAARAAKVDLRETNERSKARAQIADQVMGGVSGVGKMAFGAGKAVLSTGLEAAGVNLDVGSLMAKGVGLEETATKVTNSAYMPGQAGPNGQRQDPRALVAQVRGVADSTATDTNVAMSALDKFVAKTGDLQTGRDMLQKLAELSRATGADLSDMADAAGDVSNQLGDIPNKGAATVDVLKLVTAQGKEGAVEIKDLASQMAKVAAAAGRFEGDKGQNIAQFAALTQLTRAKGGAASATQAATSVSAFQGTFSKGARLDAFDRFKVNVNGANGQRRDAESIILDSIKAAATRNGGMKNFDRNMGTMFADRGARRVTTGFESTFQENYAKAQGTEQQRITEAIAETRAAFDSLKGATMDDAQVAENLANVMKTSGAQGQLLNNRLEASAATLDEKFKPALIGLANAAIPLAETMATMLGYVTGQDIKDEQNAPTVDALSAQNATASAAGRLNYLHETQDPNGPNMPEKLSPEDQAALDKARAKLAGTIGKQKKGAPAWLQNADDAAVTRVAKSDDPQADAAAAELQNRQSIVSNEKILTKLDELIRQSKADPSAVMKVQLVGGNTLPPKADTTNVPNGAPGMPPGFDH